MEKVIAVVVTYNRQQLLSECVNALRSQSRPVDSILVINNGSTDSTEAWLNQQTDLQFISQKNLGSSGGFSRGIREAYAQGATWVWCMDDDGYPKSDALEQLLDSDDGSLRLRNCAVIDKDDKKTFVWKTQHYRTLDEVDVPLIHGIGHPFNGTLIHRNIIERVGLPQSQFFIWGEETEYYYRITKKAQIPVCTVAASIHYHPHTAFSLKQDWNYSQGWKMYYYIRNRFHIHRVKFNNPVLALLNYFSFLAAFAVVTLLFQKTDRFKKIGFIFWPVLDAFRGNFDIQPPLILAELQRRDQYSFTRNLNMYFRNLGEALLLPFTLALRPRRTAEV